jgi:tRNA nucleotidyltransferase (CCA-adding enzyme)
VARIPAALARASFPAPVLEVLRRLGAAGHRSWLVGGAVRDLLLHRPRLATDFDVATPATPDAVSALFRKVIPTGIEHGTVTVLAHGHAVEVTTFRGEGAYEDGRRPGSVTFLTDLEADLARRDFTMNALAYDPLLPELRDPFDGRSDLRRGIVRAVGDPRARFGEDGLRPLRAVRFAAQLGFALHPRTRAAIPGALEVVRKVSRERVADELSRLVVAPRAERGVALLRATGLVEVVLPALAALPRGDLAHAARVLARAPTSDAVRWAALLHVLPAGEVAPLLLSLRLSRRLAEEASVLVRAHACRVREPRGTLPGSPVAVRRWLAEAGPARAGALLALAEAEAGSLPAPRGARARAEVKELATRVARTEEESPPLAIGDLAIDGAEVMRVLGARPGPYVGEALRHLLERVLEDPAENVPDRLADALRRWWDARPRL